MPEEVARAIGEIADASLRDFSSVANEMLSEAVKMWRCPGIIFAEGTSGRRARIPGTGLDVWEVIATHKSLAQDFERLRHAYHWLSDLQLRAAFGYYAAYPEEVEGQIARNEVWTREWLAKQYPTLTPDQR